MWRVTFVPKKLPIPERNETKRNETKRNDDDDDAAAADAAAAAPAAAEAAVPELGEMVGEVSEAALSRVIEEAAAAAGQDEAATAALRAHLRLKLTVDARRCEGQLLHATRIVDALLPPEGGSVQLWEANPYPNPNPNPNPNPDT